MNLGILDSVGHQQRGAETPSRIGSQARRRSLNVPRLGWSGDTTAGHKPEGCASTPGSTPAAGGFQTRKEDLKLLNAIATSKVFIEFGRAFTQATGLPVALRPAESLHLSFHDCRKQGPFCALMARENRTCGACLQSQSQVAQAAVKGPHTIVCYAGLQETVVPLRLGSRLIGFLWTGQVFQRKPTEPQFRRTLKLLSSWGTDFDHDAVRGAYFEMRVVSREQHAAAVKLLTIFAEHLATLSNQILIQRDNIEPPMITKAKNFIREHHAEDLSLSLVARVANASPFYFCKLFKQATGVSFTNFVSRVRVERSKHLLINPQLRVSEVAFAAGFQSLSHFNRVFLQILGQSPTEYREKLKGSDQPICG